jgi:streptogramin lyase
MVESGDSMFRVRVFDCPVQSVNTIASDKKGMVWFAGNDGALYRFNGRSFLTIDTSRFLEKR